MAEIETLDTMHEEDRELVMKLAKLQNMHKQITTLRSLLPEGLLRPTRMALQNPRGVSPEKLAANLRQAALEGSRDIQRFKKEYHSPEMRELWQKTGTADFAQGRDSWTVDYEDLVTNPNADGKPITTLANTDQTSHAETTEDEEAVIKQYQDAPSPLKIAHAGASSIYPLDLVVDGLSFRISKQDQDGKQVLSIGSKPESQPSILSKAIIENINTMHNMSSLQLLLSLLASYEDLKFQGCDECHTIFDDEMRYPLLRRRKVPAVKDSKTIDWERFHPGCAP